MQKYAVVNKDKFPLVRVTFTGNAANKENFSDYLTNLEQIYVMQKK